MDTASGKRSLRYWLYDRWIGDSGRFPMVLWVLLIVGMTVNGLYLLWPTPPERITIGPHPATLLSYEKELPVLVATPHSSGDYLIVQPDNRQDGKPAPKVLQRVHTSGPLSLTQSKNTFQGVLNLNTASATQLQLLPGIGPKLAQRIIQYRQSHGPFSTLEALADVPGIGPKKLAQLMPHLKL